MWWLLAELLEEKVLGPRRRRDRAFSSRRKLTYLTENRTHLSVRQDDPSTRTSEAYDKVRSRGGRPPRASESPVMRRDKRIVGRGALGYSDSEDTDSDLGSPRLYEQNLSPDRPPLSRHVSQSSTTLMRSPSLRVVPLTWSPLHQSHVLSDEDSPNEDRDSEGDSDSSRSDDEVDLAFDSKNFVFRPGMIKVVESYPEPMHDEAGRESSPLVRRTESLRSDVADLNRTGGGSVLFDRPVKDESSNRSTSSYSNALNINFPSMTRANIFGGFFPSQRAAPPAEDNIPKIQHELPTREASIATVIRRPLPSKSTAEAVASINEENWEAQIPLHPKQVSQVGKRSSESDWQIIKEEFERFSDEV